MTARGVAVAVAVAAATAVLAACPRHHAVPVVTLAPPDAGPARAVAVPDAAPAVAVPDAPLEQAIGADTPPPLDDREWLKGSTHVHAAPSGDSETPVADVMRWYESHGYDFIVLTDHNQVTAIDSGTTGSPVVHAPAPGAHGLIVLAGTELTHNPDGCLPPGDGTPHCRIHVNLLGVTARPQGKLDWTTVARASKLRVDKYQAALDQRATLGPSSLAQLNHPQWLWGMTPALIVELAQRGFQLVEIENAAFSVWGKGDATHPSVEALWDHALSHGAHLWGVASDDAHDYTAGGRYPPGGGWIVVHAHRTGTSILDAIRDGDFYASTGIELARVEVTPGRELLVSVAGSPASAAQVTTELITTNGVVIATVRGGEARFAIPIGGYLRARLSRLRLDGTTERAWTQPVYGPGPQVSQPTGGAR